MIPKQGAIVAQALFALRGGDSPWHKSRFGPAATPGAGP